jgi:hypothetical protein
MQVARYVSNEAHRSIDVPECQIAPAYRARVVFFARDIGAPVYPHLLILALQLSQLTQESRKIS